MRQSLQDTFGDDLPGVAYGSTGGILGGDYTQNNNMNRAQSLSAVCAALKGTRDAVFSAMTDVGNAYVLPYVDHLTNVATVSTGYDAEDDSVPFYEMVIHGSISYAGTAQNLANDQTTARLDAVSMGAAPYMALITREDTLIANTVYEWQWYSLNADDQLTMLTAYAAETMAIRQRVSDAAMISREVSGDIAVTTYSDGTKVYVNYGYTEQMRDGITVPAQGFAQGG